MLNHRVPIGIDALAISVPSGYVELSELALARGIPKEKYLTGLGVKQMSVAQKDEDPVTLAANAARRLFLMSGCDPKEIGLCVVGTETAVDHAKPISAFLHSLLGLSPACRIFEAKHACFGGTAGLLNALDWIASGSARGKSALVVCTDIARYPLESAGEPTQGAGAIALLIKENPRLLELEVGHSGSYSRDVYDFWRPLYRKEALTDGHFSVQCYLEALSGAYGEWKKWDESQERSKGKNPLSRICYHVPYGKMAKKAHHHLKMLEGFSQEEADASFQNEVAASLELPSQVGNVYTGSLYMALASLLQKEGSSLAGRRIGLFSYGSGCAAEFFAGRVPKQAEKWVEKLQIDAPLQNRRSLSIPEYEAIRRADLQEDEGTAPSGVKPFRGETHTSFDLHKPVKFLGLDAAERRIYSIGILQEENQGPQEDSVDSKWDQSIPAKVT